MKDVAPILLSLSGLGVIGASTLLWNKTKTTKIPEHAQALVAKPSNPRTVSVVLHTFPFFCCTLHWKFQWCQQHRYMVINANFFSFYEHLCNMKMICFQAIYSKSQIP
jgi:hypothetical protein